MRDSNGQPVPAGWALLNLFSLLTVFVGGLLSLTVVGMILGIPMITVGGFFLSLSDEKIKTGKVGQLRDHIVDFEKRPRRNPCFDNDDTRNGDLGYRSPYRG